MGPDYLQVHQVAVHRDSLFGQAVDQNRSMVDQDDPFAVFLYVVHVVGHQQDGLTSFAEVADTFEAFFLKAYVADCQNLIDGENLGIDFNSNGEGQSHVHSGGVLLDRGIDKVANIGEVDNPSLSLQHLPFGVAHQQSVDQDVFPASQ